MADSTGRKLLSSADLDAALEIDAAVQIEGLEQQDALMTSLLERCLDGRMLVEHVPPLKPTKLLLNDLSPSDRAVLEKRYALENQQSRGAWYHPDKASLNAGYLNLPYYYENHPGFPMNAVTDGRVSVSLDVADSLMIWGALELLVIALFGPLRLLGPDAVMTPAKREKEVLKVKRTLLDLSISSFDVENLRLETNVVSRQADELRHVKYAYLAALQVVDASEIVRRFRVAETLSLAKRFYQKRRTMSATRENVLTKRLERTLTGFYAGDWTELLAYLGETAEMGDEVQTSLPPPTVLPGINADAAAIARTMNIEPSQVEEAVASLFPEAAAGTNPVKIRLEALRTFWKVFRELHARQETGMPSLWGFVQQIDRVDIPAAATPERRMHYGSPSQFADHLPAKFRADVNRLWATKVLAKYPETLVTNLTPYYWMAEAFGPALAFWEGVFLTAWYVTEGPYSRTDLAGMETYYAKQVKTLKDLGVPVPTDLFEALRKAERKLGKPEMIYETRQSLGEVQGVEFEMRLGGWQRRDGFEHLRDIISKRLEGWSERYLDTYLDAQWRSPLEDLSVRVSKRLASKGKAFTPKQFAKYASHTANAWFGGDLSAVSIAILQPSPVKQTHKRAIPKDILAHTDYLYHQWTDVASANNLKVRVDDYEDKRNYLQVETLTRLSFDYLQLAEALGEVPTQTEFASTLKTYDKDAVARLLRDVIQEPSEAWTLFVETSGRRPAPGNSGRRQGANPPMEKRSARMKSQAQATKEYPSSASTDTEIERKTGNWFRRVLKRMSK